MKTTIDIPEILYKRAKIRAVEQHTSLKKLMLNALERELIGSTYLPNEKVETFVLREDGFPVLARREGLAVTDETVNQLRQQEGV